MKACSDLFVLSSLLVLRVFKRCLLKKKYICYTIPHNLVITELKTTQRSLISVTNELIFWICFSAMNASNLENWNLLRRWSSFSDQNMAAAIYNSNQALPPKYFLFWEELVINLLKISTIKQLGEKNSKGLPIQFFGHLMKTWWNSESFLISSWEGVWSTLSFGVLFFLILFKGRK